MIEQGRQNLLMQKQNFQMQLMEIESALKELEGVESAYRIVGNIMVEQQKDSLEKDLGMKKESAELRIKTLEKQEEKLRQRADELQKEVLKGMKEK